MALTTSDISVGIVAAYLQLRDDGFFDTVNRAESALEDFEDDVNTSTSGLANAATTLTGWGDTLTRNVTTPLLNGAKDVINTYRDMESAFTGVKKTVDETKFKEAFGEQADGWAILDQAIKDISQSTASTYEEVAAVMEWAGQLNVPLGKGGESITEFTRVMVELGDSTNLTAEQAAEAIAKLMNIMGTAPGEVRNLGSAIVDLGNNSATTEAEIVNMAMRLAGAGAQIGLTEQEVLGISAALNSVGIRAEMGGSAFSKAMVKMQVAVETGYDSVQKLESATGMTLRDLELMSTNDTKAFKALAQSLGMTTTEMKDVIKAGNNLNDFADIAGMKTEDFVKLYKEDAVGALQAFINGLGDTEGHGESAIAMLDEMGFREVRLRDTLLRLSNAQGLLDENIERANRAWNDNTALTIESDKRYAILDSKINQLNERWKVMKYEIAEMLLPVLEDLMDLADKLISTWGDLSDEQKESVIHFLEVAAVAGPVLVVLGSILGALSNIINFIRIIRGLNIAGSINTNLLPAINNIGPALSGAGSSISAFFGQDVGVLAASGASGVGTIFATAVVTAVAAYGISNKLAQLISSAIGDEYMASLYEEYSGFAGFFKLCNDTVTTAAEELEETLSRNLYNTDQANRETREFIDSVDDELTRLDELKEKNKNVVDSDKEFITKTGEVTKSVDEAASSFEHLHPVIQDANDVQDEMPDKIKAIKDEYNFLKGPVEETKGVVHDFMEENKKVDDVVKDTTQSFEYLHPVINDVAKEEEAATEKAEDLKNEFTFLKEPVEDVSQKTLTDFMNQMNNTQTVMQETGDAAKGLGEDIIAGVQEPIENANPESSVKSFFDKLWEGFKKIFGIASPAEQMKPIGQFILDGIVEGFTSSFGDFTKGITDFYDKTVKPWFDPSKWNFPGVAEGLSKTYDNANKQTETFSKNMNTQGKNVSTQLNNGIVEGSKSISNTVKTIGKNIVTGVWNGMVSSQGSFYSSVKSFFSGLVSSAKSELGIHSPSQVFANEVGYWIPLGIAEGVDESMPDAVDDIQDTIDDGMEEVDPDVKFQTSFNDFINDFRNDFDELTSWIDNIENSFIESINNMTDSLNKMLDVTDELISSYDDRFGLGYNSGIFNSVSVENSLREMFDKFLVDLSNTLSYNTSGGTGSVNTGDWYFPLYFGGELVDTLVLTAQQRNNYRSGGR